MTQYGNKIWEELFSTDGWGKYPPEEVIRFFMTTRKKINKTIIKALDIGSGMGACSWFMRKEGAEVTAIDGAPSGIKNVPILAKDFGIQNDFKLILGDITKPKNFIGNEFKFDILLDNYSLYSNQEEKIISALEEYYNILTEGGGYFLMNCFGEKTSGFGTGKQLSEHTWSDISQGGLHNRGVVTWFTRERLNKIFTKIGFTVNYYENILLDRNGIMVEKHITSLKK